MCSVYEVDWVWFERNRREVMFEMCEMRKVLESDHSPISLQLKLYEVRECEEVFGGVSSRDVNMSAPSQL